MASATAQGDVGPHAHHPGWAVFMFALCGVSELTGHPGVCFVSRGPGALTRLVEWPVGGDSVLLARGMVPGRQEHVAEDLHR